MTMMQASMPGTVQGSAVFVAATTSANLMLLNRKMSSPAVTSHAAARPRCFRIENGSGSLGGRNRCGIVGRRRGGGRQHRGGGWGGRRREIDGDVDGAARGHV